MKWVSFAISNICRHFFVLSNSCRSSNQLVLNNLRSCMCRMWLWFEIIGLTVYSFTPAKIRWKLNTTRLLPYVFGQDQNIWRSQKLNEFLERFNVRSTVENHSTNILQAISFFILELYYFVWYSLKGKKVRDRLI